MADDLAAVDAALRGVPGLTALTADPLGRAELELRAADASAALARLEATLDAALDELDVAGSVETLNSLLIRAKDATWAIAHDRLRSCAAVLDMSQGALGTAALEAYHALQLTLSALDRLEVRGRDSAGIQVLVSGHGLDLTDPTVQHLLAPRLDDPLFRSRSVRVADGCLSFVYKTAAEIGELGDNTAALRAQIHDDDMLRLALRADSARALVLAHTRWASIGIISEPNAHPLNSDETDHDGSPTPYLVASLNGDVDNYADLIAHEGLRIATEITTDAKVIPTLVARKVAGGAALPGAIVQGAPPATGPARGP